MITGLGYSQNTYTFTSGGATGTTAPTQVEIDAAYSGTPLDGNVTVTAGIQYWTVPTTGAYTIQAFGGQGYGSFGGRGAHITGEMMLTAGTQLKILVGQRGDNYLNWPATTYNNQYGGGGGSFVTLTDNTPLVIAGGGGGSHVAAFLPGCDGQITEAGAAGAQGNITSAGGTGGNGGAAASSADGGGGLLTNGGGIAGGIAYVNGGAGGFDEGFGGFGCGGGTSSWNNVRAGGGGGYSGGGAGNNGGACCAAGGGGGSYNSGTNPINLAGIQLGDGEVIISLNCIPTVGSLVADSTSLPDLSADCVVSSWTVPTASNSCPGANYLGTPDVSLPINAVGTTVVTWTFDDGTNIATQTQNVIITGIDTNPPVLDAASLITFNNPCGFTPPTPTATDFCAGSINGVPDVALPITTQGTNIITWTFDDGSGNSVTQQQTININDVSDPVPDVAILDTYQGCNSATPPAPTATDFCVGAIVGTPDVTFPITTAGSSTVTWTYDDGNGNTSTQTQDIFVNTTDLTVDVNGTQLLANQTQVSYQWIDCATGQAIAGATGQGFIPSVTGEYAAIISDENCTDTTECVLVDFTGIDELNSNKLNIYPNPSNTGLFTVDFEGAIEDILVVDALGRTIELPVDFATGAVNGSTLEAGRYTVRVFASDAVYSKALVIIE
jgi:hypothetical protein